MVAALVVTHRASNSLHEKDRHSNEVLHSTDGRNDGSVLLLTHKHHTNTHKHTHIHTHSLTLTYTHGTYTVETEGGTCTGPYSSAELSVRVPGVGDTEPA